MSYTPMNLKPFERRVRIARAWRGAAVGLCVGGALAAVWALADWRQWAMATPLQLGVLALAGLLTGALVGLVRRVPSEALARSIDRRANLEDRLATALEVPPEADGFAAAARTDAETRMATVRPRDLYPVRMSRWHFAGLTTCLVAAAFFTLGNTPLLMSPQAKAQREEQKRQAAELERVVRPILQRSGDMNEDERRLARDVMEFQRQLERTRMSREEAMRKGNELVKRGEELAKQRAELTRQQLEKMPGAQLAMQRMGEDAKAMRDADAQAAQMDAEMASIQKQIQSLESQLAASNAAPKPGEGRGAKDGKEGAAGKGDDSSKSKQEGLEAELRSLREQLQQLKLSREALETFRRMMQDPIWREIQELARKLSENAEATSKTGRPTLTPEELEEMRRKLEELAKRLQDPEAIKEYLEAIREALKNAKKAGECNGMCLGVGGALGLPMGMGGGGMSLAEDTMGFDTGQINKSDKELPGQGKTVMQAVRGQRRDLPGQETSITIKAPTSVGSRSSVPYRSVLPTYRRKAESAIERDRIPKEHQKRVREYFDSLGAG